MELETYNHITTNIAQTYLYTSFIQFSFGVTLYYSVQRGLIITLQWYWKYSRDI